MNSSQNHFLYYHAKTYMAKINGRFHKHHECTTKSNRPSIEKFAQTRTTTLEGEDGGMGSPPLNSYILHIVRGESPIRRSQTKSKLRDMEEEQTLG